MLRSHVLQCIHYLETNACSEICVLRTALYMLLHVAIAAHALFEGMRPLILTEYAHSSRNLIMGRGSNIEEEFLALLPKVV